MTELQVRAILAGLFFGIWPIVMSWTGLKGNASAAAFSGITFLIVMPLALQGTSFSDLAQANWKFALLAGLAGALGVLAFNGGLAISTKETVSTFFVLMIAVQIVVPAVYQVIVTKSATPFQLTGFALAIGAAFFLNK